MPYVNKKEAIAIDNARGYVNNLLEGCTADENIDEGKKTLEHLNRTLEGLDSLQKKLIKLGKYT